MASDRIWPAQPGSPLRTGGSALISIVLGSLTAGNVFADPIEKVRDAKAATAALLGVPLSFEANQGQTDSRVKFLSRGDGYSLFLTSQEAVFTLRPPGGAKAPPSVVRMELKGANRGSQLTGADKQEGVANYYIGNDPKKWRSGITTYGKVKYQGIYPGIDAVFYGNQRQLEYDFVIAPGADPKQISLGLTGARPSLDADGNVVLKLADGDLALKKPVVYQNVIGEKKFVEASYTIVGNKVRFRLGKYDRTQTLVIDPVFTYLTYLGGSSVDYIGGVSAVGQVSSPNQALAIDSAGNVYVTGETISNDFPVANAYQATRNEPGSAYTAFVSALNSTGTALLYSTYLGGSVSNNQTNPFDIGASIAWDSFDNAVYVVGTTNAVDFPTTPGAFQTKNPNGLYFSFVAKFSASGQLTNSTFLGAGSAGYEYGLGVAADSLGQAYIVGFTSYDNCPAQSSQGCFPTTSGAVIPSYNTVSNSDYGNGFVSVFNPSLSTLLYSTLLGDPNGASNGYGTEAFGVAVDPSGNFYVVGQTGATTLPVTSAAFQTTLVPSNGIPVVGFAAKFGPVSAKGASLLYLTYLKATGESFTDVATGVAADSQGNAYIGGYTHSPTFPVTSGAIQNVCDPNTFPYNCAFVAKLNPTGTGLVWSTFVEPASFLTAIQLDTQGNVYVAGNNNGFFQAVNAVEPSLNQGGAFVAKVNSVGSALLFSSLIGGTDGVGSLALTGLAVDAPGNIYIAGYDRDTTLPTTPGAFQTALKNPGTGNSYDGYIGKISFPEPTITGVANAEGEAPTIAPNTWVAIYGMNLAKAGDTRIWMGSDFVNGQLPTQLDGVSVTVNGKPAYVYYISPAQLNILTPPDALTGPVNVVVTSNAVSSAPYLAKTQPESPSFFVFNGGPYIAAVHLNGGLIGPATLYPGASTPAQPSETIMIYANGFGPTSTPVVSGSSSQSGSLSPSPVIDIGGIAATVSFAGLVAPGEFQFNVIVPSSLANGDQPVTATYNGLTTQAGTLLTVHQ
jgi:uncharacterized protein (TIGR03437 family)